MAALHGPTRDEAQLGRGAPVPAAPPQGRSVQDRSVKGRSLQGRSVQDGMDEAPT